MVSGVHGVESEAALCPGRGISGPGGRAVEPAEGTRATRASSSGVPITNEGSQSLSEDPLGHSCERYQARAVPAPQPTSLPVDQPSSSHEADSDRLLGFGYAGRAMRPGATWLAAVAFAALAVGSAYPNRALATVRMWSVWRYSRAYTALPVGIPVFGSDLAGSAVSTRT